MLAQRQLACGATCWKCWECHLGISFILPQNVVDMQRGKTGRVLQSLGVSFQHCEIHFTLQADIKGSVCLLASPGGETKAATF